MKGSVYFAIGALCLGAASVQGGSHRPAGKEGCVCTGTCQIKGDPHVLNVFNQQYVEKRKSFTIYEQGNFAITADTAGRYYVQSINFGGEKVSVEQCHNKEGKLTKLEKNGVTMDVYCKLPSDQKKYGSELHLDSFFTFQIKQDASAKKAAHGVCMDEHKDETNQPEPGVDPTPDFKKNKPMQCKCLSKCSVEGDPHLTSFFGVKELITAKDFSLYKMDNFEISAKVDDSHYITDITVKRGSKTQHYSLDDCKNQKDSDGRQLRGDGTLEGHRPFRPKVLDRFNMKVKLGSVEGQVNCALEQNGKKKGSPMLNFYLNKVTETQGAGDFSTAETKLVHSSGFCMDGHK